METEFAKIMKAKQAMEYLQELEGIREYYEEYSITKVKTEGEFELAKEIVKSVESMILSFVEKMSK